MELMCKMDKFLLVLCLQILLRLGESCETLEGAEGNCTSLLLCKPYMKVIIEIGADCAKKIIQKITCDYDGAIPKVCCPLPRTPKNTPITPELRTTTEKSKVDSESRLSQGNVNEPSDVYVSAFPEPPVCGASNASFGRVVGGQKANLGDVPWIALLGYQGERDQTTQWRCGGSLITSLHVLTAAHCIHNRENELYVVRLGELDLSRDDDGADPIDVLIKTKIKHERYNSATFENDIGVLVLEQLVEFNDFIRPICIPFREDLRSQTFENWSPMIAGWGQVELNGAQPDHLQVVQLKVQTNALCSKAYRQYKVQVIDDRVLCAGYEGGKGSCKGDSGGPLMLPVWDNKNFKSSYYQIGVISFSRNCAEAGFPGVLTRVTHFLPWLEKVVLGVSSSSSTTVSPDSKNKIIFYDY